MEALEVFWWVSWACCTDDLQLRAKLEQNKQRVWIGVSVKCLGILNSECACKENTSKEQVCSFSLACYILRGFKNISLYCVFDYKVLLRHFFQSTLCLCVGVCCTVWWSTRSHTQSVAREPSPPPQSREFLVLAEFRACWNVPPLNLWTILRHQVSVLWFCEVICCSCSGGNVTVLAMGLMNEQLIPDVCCAEVAAKLSGQLARR